MLRGTMRQAIEDIDFENLTIRAAVEWYKGVLSVTDDPTPEENEYMQSAWVAIINALSAAQQVPVGFLGYMVSELVRYEMSLANTAAEEAVQAGIVVA